MTRERWVRDLADAARGYNEPPAVPRDRMWERIDAARSGARRADVVVEPAVPWWSRRRVLWPAAVVAALAVGLFLGRITSSPVAPTNVDPIVTAPAVDQEPRTPGTPTTDYRLAATPVLERTEALLLQVRTDTGQVYTGRAATLLTETRLLLASPAADDPELAPLLRDLELALVRVVRLTAGARSGDGVAPDQRALQAGLDRKAVLPRIRDLLAAKTVAAES